MKQWITHTTMINLMLILLFQKDIPTIINKKTFIMVNDQKVILVRNWKEMNQIVNRELVICLSIVMIFEQYSKLMFKFY